MKYNIKEIDKIQKLNSGIKIDYSKFNQERYETLLEKCYSILDEFGGFSENILEMIKDPILQTDYSIDSKGNMYFYYKSRFRKNNIIMMSGSLKLIPFSISDTIQLIENEVYAMFANYSSEKIENVVLSVDKVII